MAGEGDTSHSQASCQLSGSRKMFWRSASWSASRTSPLNPGNEDKDSAGPSDNAGNANGQNARYKAAPLTPRSQQNCKARACLPPLQPLSIARHSLDEWPRAASDDLGEWPDPPTPSGNRNGERLKLDLSSIQRNSEKSSGNVKRDKLAFFDKECSKIAEHVYLGGDAVAKDRDILKHNGITHILNCVGFACPEYFKSDFVYRTLWLQDSPSEDIISILYDVFDYFEDVRDKKGRVFVHCCQGVSRSTSLVIAYLMWKKGQSFDDAFQHVKAARGIADPNVGFACQLLQCQKRIHAHPLSPGSLLRMYRMAPHSSYDPLHLVPKMLNDPSPSALDSRGAFIVHVPSAIYIWIGKSCESVLEKDTKGAACQIVRYERVQGPIIVIHEGEEPAYFWDAFGNLLPLMDKSVTRSVIVKDLITKIQPGKRKVDAYDVDFEILHKAIKGGFLPPFVSSGTEYEAQLPARESGWSVLRHKFASCVLKDLLSSPKISLSRVYSDSMMIAHSSSPTSSSSTSSSPFLSPDSIASDLSSSSNHLSESSLDSPSAAGLCSLPVHSNLPDISNLSLHTSVTSQFTSQLKKVLPSLAERRGTMSKSLKLPGINVSKSPSSVNNRQKDDSRICDDSRTVCKPDVIDIVFDSNDCYNKTDICISQNLKLAESLCRVDNADLCHKEAISIDDCNGAVGNFPIGEGLGSEVSTHIDDSGSNSNPVQPLVCNWPSMEKTTGFSKGNLDSRSAMAVFSPHKSVGQREGRILYFWIGRSFLDGSMQVQIGSNDGLGNIEDIDWNQVGSEVLTQMGMPKDTDIEIIREGEEPEEFLALLSTSEN